MKAVVEGREYYIEFQYINWNSPFDREVTRCLIRDGSTPAPGDGTFPVIATGEVRRYYKDRPDRDKARKAALAKALDAITRVDGYDASGGAGKALRRVFWEAYLNRKKPVALAASNQFPQAATCKPQPQAE